ncbi:MAG: response regulator [bacterium]
MANIIVVERSVEVTRLLVDILEEMGHEVLSLTHPELALAELDREDRLPDLVISNYLFEGIRGHQLADKLAMKFGDRRPPFILISGGIDNGITPRPSVDKFLAKPFSPEDLLTIIEELLSKQQRKEGVIKSRGSLHDDRGCSFYR